MASGYVNAPRDSRPQSERFESEATQIIRRERVAETIVFSSFGASGMAVTPYQAMTLAGTISANVLVESRIVNLRESYCNGLAISSIVLNDGELGSILVRLMIKRDQTSPLGSDILIFLDQLAGHNQSIVIPLFCNVYRATVHAFENVGGTSTDIGKATQLTFF